MPDTVTPDSIAPDTQAVDPPTALPVRAVPDLSGLSRTRLRAMQAARPRRAYRPAPGHKVTDGEVDRYLKNCEPGSEYPYLHTRQLEGRERAEHIRIYETFDGESRVPLSPLSLSDGTADASKVEIPEMEDEEVAGYVKLMKLTPLQERILHYRMKGMHSREISRQEDIIALCALTPSRTRAGNAHVKGQRMLSASFQSIERQVVMIQRALNVLQSSCEDWGHRRVFIAETQKQLTRPDRYYKRDKKCRCAEWIQTEYRTDRVWRKPTGELDGEGNEITIPIKYGVYRFVCNGCGSKRSRDERDAMMAEYEAQKASGVVND